MLDAAILAFMATIVPMVNPVDLNFEYAQEAFVVKAVPGFQPPAKVAVLLKLAGDDEYCCREAASYRLSKVHPRWLFHGLNSRDLEVSVRCSMVLRNITQCRECNNTGSCAYWHPVFDMRGNCVRCKKDAWYHDISPGTPCVTCDGVGRLWNHLAFELPRW